MFVCYFMFVRFVVGCQVLATCNGLKQMIFYCLSLVENLYRSSVLLIIFLHIFYVERVVTKCTEIFNLVFISNIGCMPNFEYTENVEMKLRLSIARMKPRYFWQYDAPLTISSNSKQTKKHYFLVKNLSITLELYQYTSIYLLMEKELHGVETRQ